MDKGDLNSIIEGSCGEAAVTEELSGLAGVAAGDSTLAVHGLSRDFVDDWLTGCGGGTSV